MRVLALAHGLWFGGAQVATLELPDLLRSTVRLKVLTCEEGDAKFLDVLGAMGIETYRGAVPKTLRLSHVGDRAGTEACRVG